MKDHSSGRNTDGWERKTSRSGEKSDQSAQEGRESCVRESAIVGACGAVGFLSEMMNEMNDEEAMVY